jgi:hypothetical protein
VKVQFALALEQVIEIVHIVGVISEPYIFGSIINNWYKNTFLPKQEILEKR